MPLIAGVDFETTGLNPVTDRITEVGAVLWDTELGQPLLIQSFFIDWELEEMDPVVEKITGITTRMLSTYGVRPMTGWKLLNNVIESADVVCAHNGTAFDKPFYANYGLHVQAMPADKLWIDTQTDIEYDENIKTRKLTHLAAEHSFLNPFQHRAVFDVLTMLTILQQYDISQVMALAAEPVVYAQAVVTYDDRQLAKDRGYRWDGDNKIWFRTFKTSQYARERAEAPFKVREIVAPTELRGT